jgi:predicted NUDIX family NTP pyrophosphohydrolase
MASRSAGLLLYRRDSGGRLEVLLAHMGGPFWASRDRGAWTIPKGEVDDGEAPLDTARREFTEELGVPVPTGPTLHLGEVRQSGGKRVEVWAIEGELDPEGIEPGTFEMEWPKGSGEQRSFPEVDRVAWFDLAAADERVIAGQRPLLVRLRVQVA